MKCLPAIGVFTLMTVLALSVLAFAGIPQTINYQGYLKNTATGAPVSGLVSMTFSLYSSATPRNNPVWVENQPMVPVTNGIYSTQLGSATPITVPFDVPYYLGIKVARDDEMPLQPLSNVPYSFRAGSIDAGTQTVHTGQAVNLGLIVKGATGQRADLQQWQDTRGNILAAVTSEGAFSGDGSQLTGVSADKLQGSTLSDLRSLYGSRNLSPCVWTGSSVNCSGSCVQSVTDGDVTCDTTEVIGCSIFQFGSGNFCGGSLGTYACYLSCIDSAKPGWTFAESGSTSRLIRIPGTSPGRLSVQLKHPMLVCTSSASTPLIIPLSLYLYKGGIADPDLVVWRGAIKTNGGASGVRDYVAEVPVIQGEVTVQGGLNYSLWLSAGPISGGNSTAHCYWARSSTETSDNMLIRFTPGAPGL